MTVQRCCPRCPRCPVQQLLGPLADSQTRAIAPADEPYLSVVKPAMQWRCRTEPFEGAVTPGPDPNQLNVTISGPGEPALGIPAYTCTTIFSVGAQVLAGASILRRSLPNMYAALTLLCNWRCVGSSQLPESATLPMQVDAAFYQAFMGEPVTAWDPRMPALLNDQAAGCTTSQL